MFKLVRSARLLGVFVAALLVLAACGGDDDDASSSTTEAPTDTTAAPEEVAAASGEPVVVGYVTMDNGPLAQPAVGQAARAAVKYANENLGGVGGRPLQLDECATDFSPESSAACANKFIADKATLVFMGIDLGDAAMWPILEEAGIPVLGQNPLSAADYESQGMWFAGAQVSYAYGAATYFRDNTDDKNVVIYNYNLPGSKTTRDTFMVPALEKAGFTVNTVDIDYGAPDYSVYIAAAMEHNPDLLFGFLQESDCTKLIVAANQLGYTGDLFAGNCGTFVTDVPDLADGIYTAGDMYAPSDLTKATDQAKDDIGMYLDGMKASAPDTPQSVFTQFMYAGIMNLRALLESVGPDNITSDSVVKALQATKDEPSFMADTYGCSEKPVADYPNICSANVLMFQGKDGKLAQVSDWIFGPDLFAG